MNVQVLIDSIVKQTTVLIAQLATSGGLRAPLAHVANQVFLDLASELEAQGVSRKVSADMFGMALRAYLKKVQRLTESKTERGQSLWSAVYAYLRAEGVVSRRAVLDRFHKDDTTQVRSVLHDLSESGLAFVSGTGSRAMFRAASVDELGKMAGNGEDDELLWAIVFREGPISLSDLKAAVPSSSADLEAKLQRLLDEGRVESVQSDAGLMYSAATFSVPLGADSGWEAAVYDHHHALVQTVCRKLQTQPRSDAGDETGASTYTFETWRGHPLDDEIRGTLSRFREQYSDLRQRVREYNAEHPAPGPSERVVVYAGQHVSEVEP